jgi:hypothetical protein
VTLIAESLWSFHGYAQLGIAVAWPVGDDAESGDACPGATRALLRSEYG